VLVPQVELDWALSPVDSELRDFGVIAFWAAETGPHERLRDGVFVDDLDLPQIEEVDAWEAVADLEQGIMAWGAAPPWPQLREVSRAEAGASRPATVSTVAVLLLMLAMIHSVGALGSLSLGLGAPGSRAVVAGVLALVIGIGETVCAVQVTRGRAWARLAAAGLGALMLLWLTMAPLSPGALTILVFATWLGVGALLVHPMTSRFFEATSPDRSLGAADPA
jgi:hypothetical protein